MCVDYGTGNIYAGNGDSNPQPNATLPTNDLTATHNIALGRGLAPSGTTTSTNSGNLWYDDTLLVFLVREGAAINAIAPHSTELADLMGLSITDPEYQRGVAFGFDLYTQKGVAYLVSDPTHYKRIRRSDW